MEGGDKTGIALRSIVCSMNVTFPLSIVSSLLGVEMARRFDKRSFFRFRPGGALGVKRSLIKPDCVTPPKARAGVVLLRGEPERKIKKEMVNINQGNLYTGWKVSLGN